MGFAGFGKTKIHYEMFDLEQSAAEAKQLTKCERIYHRGQSLAWDGQDVLGMLLEKHGGIHVSEEKRHALKRIFAIIMWGELAAWRISAQLADRLVPLEAKMAATSQAHDEARHFYVMYDYLRELGYVPERMDRAPQALLDLVLETGSLAHKLLGMQLMVETFALTIFQMVRELEPEPVIAELMKYYERDEARHVGLGMQYMPVLMGRMGKVELSRMLVFQARLLFWALWETKVLEPDVTVLGADMRVLLERAQRKQAAVMRDAFEAVGLNMDHNPMLAVFNGAAEILFPLEENRGSRRRRWKAAWLALRGGQPEAAIDELDVHSNHEIVTARGVVGGERMTS